MWPLPWKKGAKSSQSRVAVQAIFEIFYFFWLECASPSAYNFLPDFCQYEQNNVIYGGNPDIWAVCSPSGGQGAF
jgi:hypothetical protein